MRDSYSEDLEPTLELRVNKHDVAPALTVGGEVQELVPCIYNLGWYRRNWPLWGPVFGGFFMFKKEEKSWQTTRKW